MCGTLCHALTVRDCSFRIYLYTHVSNTSYGMLIQHQRTIDTVHVRGCRCRQSVFMSALRFSICDLFSTAVSPVFDARQNVSAQFRQPQYAHTVTVRSRAASGRQGAGSGETGRSTVEAGGQDDIMFQDLHLTVVCSKQVCTTVLACCPLRCRGGGLRRRKAATGSCTWRRR